MQNPDPQTTKGNEMSEVPKCNICGEPMPEGEDMFMYHGYSGPCPKPPLPREKLNVDMIRDALEMYGENCDCEKEADAVFKLLLEKLK